MTDEKLSTSLSDNGITSRSLSTDQIYIIIDRHYSLDSEDDFRLGYGNVGYQQQFPLSQRTGVITTAETRE